MSLESIQSLVSDICIVLIPIVKLVWWATLLILEFIIIKCTMWSTACITTEDNTSNEDTWYDHINQYLHWYGPRFITYFQHNLLPCWIIHMIFYFIKPFHMLFNPIITINSVIVYFEYVSPNLLLRLYCWNKTITISNFWIEIIKFDGIFNSLIYTFTLNYWIRLKRIEEIHRNYW